MNDTGRNFDWWQRLYANILNVVHISLFPSLSTLNKCQTSRKKFRTTEKL